MLATFPASPLLRHLLSFYFHLSSATSFTLCTLLPFLFSNFIYSLCSLFLCKQKKKSNSMEILFLQFISFSSLTTSFFLVFPSLSIFKRLCELFCSIIPRYVFFDVSNDFLSTSNNLPRSPISLFLFLFRLLLYTVR